MKKIIFLLVIFGMVVLLASCGRLSKEQWGKEVNGLIMQLTGPESVEVNGPFEVNIILKNISSKPIILEWGYPSYFNCRLNMLDQNGYSLEWVPPPKVITILPPPVTINPNKIYTVTKRLNKDGHFTSPLKAGMKLTITAYYEEGKGKYVPDAWSGILTSNPISVNIVDNNP